MIGGVVIALVTIVAFFVGAFVHACIVIAKNIE